MTTQNATATATKTTKAKAPKNAAKTKVAASKAKTPKAATPKREKTAKGDLMTFAFRMPKADSADLHKAAGPGRASRVMKALAGAFVTGDRAEFETIVKESREARSSRQ